MGRTARFLVSTALACASVPALPAGTALAETRTEAATVGAYYWTVLQPTTEIPEVGAQEIPPKAQTRGTDQVAEDDLPVAVVAPGEPDKFSAISFEFLGIEGATINSARLTVPISTQEGSRTTNRDPDLVVACAVDDRGFSDVDGEAVEDSPGIQCEKFKAPAKPGQTDSFVFDLTALVQQWADGENNGLVLYPAALDSPFQTVFAKKSLLRLAVDYTPATPEAPLPEEPSGPVVQPPDSGGLGGSAGGPPLSGGTLDPPAVEQPAEQPVAVPPGDGAAQPAAVNAAATDGDLSPSAAFWLAAAGVALLLVLLSLVLGHATAAPPARAVGASPLTRALERRQAAATRPRLV